jgi:hypothetical protein
MPRCSIETKEDKAFSPENITMIHAPVILNNTDAALIHDAIKRHAGLSLCDKMWMLEALRNGSSAIQLDEAIELEEALSKEEALSNAFLENAA